MTGTHFPRWGRPLSLLCIITVTALYTCPILAVDCSQDDITLTTQAEVDSFQADYGGGGVCDTVTGDLEVGDSEDIVSLSGLSAIVSIEGSLYIHDNDTLANLSGLGALENVSEDLRIFENPALVNVDALSALRRVGDWLRIADNPALVNLDGLSALDNVGDELSILSNDSLVNVDGLTSLDNIDKRLEIADNDALVSLEGLRNVRKVNGRASITGNGALPDLKGLWHLALVGEDFTIEDNGELDGVNGLSDLEDVGGKFIIRDTRDLLDLDGLFSLSSVGGLDISNNKRLKHLDGLDELIHAEEDVVVTDNELLFRCTGLELLVDALDHGEPGPGPGPSGVPDVGGSVLLTGNEDGCNSIDQALADIPLTEINRGLTDAWFEPKTSGQGILISVFEDINMVFLAWFTYDAERPPEDVTAILGEPGHRWLTAQGEYDGNEALLDVWFSEGGVFDSDEPVPALRKDGEMTLEFSTCNSALLSYELPSVNRRGRLVLERVVLDNVSLCHEMDNAE